MTSKDYALLASQPLSASATASADRPGIVISAIQDSSGRRTVISHYGDDIWELWPFFEQASRSASEMRIDWRKIPLAFKEQVKAVLYRYWMSGRPGLLRPTAGMLRDTAVRLSVFLRYLEKVGVKRLADVTSLHTFNFAQTRKDAKIGPSALKTSFLCIELLYLFRAEHIDALTFEPWEGSSAAEIAGCSHARRSKVRVESGTAVIPPRILAPLFEYASGILRNAHALLDERDAGLRSLFRDPCVLRIRDASFILIGLLSGMRCDEIVGIEVGAARVEKKDNFTYHWIKSVEHKTKKGGVEYLCSSMGLEIVHIMERWVEPYHARLEAEILAHHSTRDECMIANKAKRLHLLQSNRKRLFMGALDSVVVSGRSWGTLLKAFTENAGLSWSLAPHQLRRTYARTFVQHRLGNILLLKDQFKHATLDMTQLYAANPLQDESLYDECLTELYEYKVRTIERWMTEGEKLAGGAGKKIAIMRANAFPNRQAMIRETADKVSIRGNGHAWCLSQFAEGCGGQGLYEHTRCGPCNSSVIDRYFQQVWHGIFEQQKELRDVAKDMGPGAKQRVERDLARSKQVLLDLGISNLDE